MKDFDIEKLERKNIYKVPDHLFENIQGKVMNEVQSGKKAPIFKLNWAYTVAAAVVLIFGITFVLNSENNSTEETAGATDTYALSKPVPKTESEKAYETLKSDLTSVENTNHIVENQGSKNMTDLQKTKTEKVTTPQTVKAVSKQEETQMNEYLDSFTNSEISELASNSTQDVYLDLYN
ncbi:hypothetical protein HNP38_002244 [Chryseobacterium defluvii]|uniref:Uncharacterized protein n=1 Tax=Chryseobacterium defluvii TaxID=160396 RepID=A0A840KFZ8_9FLAO|nr:hypothetical protein [Chryseobacterium defluvii]MBB4806948.1 hypothetical protein [Chryseobacterium defluvii]